VQIPATTAARRGTDTPSADSSGRHATVGSRGLIPRDGGYEAQASALAPIQMKDGGAGAGAGVHAAAAEGIRGSGGALPHMGAIQHSFGRHDVGGISAHVGGPAADAGKAMGAEAYATGNDVAFASAPTLHTAAHEAAHVVQQRAGVQLSGGVGAAGDAYENHANKVADLVVQGRSSESALDAMAGGTRSTSSIQRAVQRTPGSGSGLTTDQGVINDWAVAVNHINGRWRHIETAQKGGVQSWYKKVEKDDPPPAWQGILKSALTIGLGAVTGGIGAVILGKMAEKAADFVVNAAVEAGKGVIGAVGGAMVDKALGDSPTDPCYAFKVAQDKTIQSIVEQEELTTSVKMNGLASKGEAEKWRGMQSIYDAIGGTRGYAETKAHDEALFSWLRTQAQSAHGKDADGTTSASGLRDNIDTSSVGTLGFRVKSSSNPSKELKVDYCEIESGKGNTDAVRKYLLASPLAVSQMRVPKVVLASTMTGAGFLGGTFNIAWDEAGNNATSTYGGAMLDGSNDNAGKAWVAMHGMRTTRRLSTDETVANFQAGVSRIRQDLFGKTLKQLGVTDIST
jgi:hypothetical protein